jgi:hypothetical protein
MSEKEEDVGASVRKMMAMTVVQRKRQIGKGR